MKRTTQAYGALGVAMLAVAAFGLPANAASKPATDDAPVILTVPTDDLASISDVRGQRVKVLDSENEGGEKTAVAFTSDRKPVLLRSLYSPTEELPRSDAQEPGLGGWVEGVNYFKDGAAQVSEEKVDFAALPKIDPKSLRLTFSTATSSSSFSAAWREDDKTAYDIYRDGKLIASAVIGSFADGGLTPGSDYNYSVLPANTGSGDEKTFQAHTLTSDAGKVATSAKDPIAAWKFQPIATWFLYNTFITDKYVAWDIFQFLGGGCVGAIGDKYAGDNRGYVTPALYADPWASTSHRTGVRMKIDFGPNVVIENKSVGASHIYNSSNQLIETRTASSSGIVFSERSVSSNLYHVKVSHEVGNPFCSTGAIRYAVYVDTWASGVMQVNGYRHPVPAHEAYGLFMNSSGTNYWTTMYRGAQGLFECVSGLCATQTISKTHTPS